MYTSCRFMQMLMACLGLVLLTSAVLAQNTPVGPGVLPGAGPMVSDQKAGSVLFYTYYESSSTNPNHINTRINITNNNPLESAVVHLFFIASCSPADAYVCLTPSQTLSATTHDFDPDSKGYIMAVAVDGGTGGAFGTGCPINFNWLTGSEFIKLGDGSSASLGAEAVAAYFTGPICAGTDFTATLNFNGTQYDRLGGVLAIDNLPSRRDGNKIRLIVIGPFGDLRLSGGGVSTIVGLLYDETEKVYSFRMTGECTTNLLLDERTPRVLNGGLDTVIGPGRTGWMRFWKVPEPFRAPGDAPGILGAVLISNTTPGANSFTGGHTLHKLTLAETSVLIPIFAPAC